MTVRLTVTPTVFLSVSPFSIPPTVFRPSDLFPLLRLSFRPSVRLTVLLAMSDIRFSALQPTFSPSATPSVSRSALFAVSLSCLDGHLDEPNDRPNCGHFGGQTLGPADRPSE
ncbi:hypothetical protein BV898_07857 [Hypsibius exemplaris]|uniref:Uncharacterized protein n=1 Tax=Hypsibius exemplaris TaxID=2072580 RepID=A0A1W0WSA9_HYPEX|nr:hypothetical protein BV898_07857 [Hypsibius exemplaris]